MSRCPVSDRGSAILRAFSRKTNFPDKEWPVDSELPRNAVNSFQGGAP